MNISELQRWFFDHVTFNGKPYALDEEQATVVLDEHKNAIVTARAGSGKTYTLIAKIIYLVCIKKISPKKILALGFNKEPQTAFRKRLETVQVDGKPFCADASDMARTFHSFACEFEYPTENKLANGNHNTNRDDYIREILDRIVDPKDIYEFVRDDSHEPKRDSYNNEKDYYAALKYTRYETLSGHKVKSRCEKIIDDYLFEHDISSKYEGVSFFPKQLAAFATKDAKYKLEEYEKIIPDFVLWDNEDEFIIWEHWGISGHETEAEKIEISKIGAIGNYYEYQKKQAFKEWFYGGSWLDTKKIKTKDAKDNKYLSNFLKIKNVIYTNFEKDEPREVFEQKICKKLEKVGITNSKLPEEILLAKFKEVKENMILTTNRLTQFIDRAEQQFPDDFRSLEKACKKTSDEQVKKFYKVCLSAYRYYLDDLLSTAEDRLVDQLFPYENYKTDFNILLSTATKNIKFGKTGKKINIDELEYVFLDEYQDFSLLFHDLIDAICRRNDAIHILAVGDNWQAINSYMGASLEYFDNFEEYFPEDVTRMKISTNRRSVESIVEAANTFMRNSIGDEDGAVAIKSDDDEFDSISDCVVKSVHDFYSEDDRVIDDNARQKYNLMLAEIVRDNAGKNIRFLNRTNEFRIEDSDRDLIQNFEKCFKLRYENLINGVNFDDDISFATVNSSKGLEADVVVILESDIGRFPIFHPDNYLYEVFGDTEQKSIDEQKRLFYVALTRAREKLYIVHKNFLNDATDGSLAKDSDFLRLFEIENYSSYEKESFLSLEAQIKRNLKVVINAIKIKFSKNKFNSNNWDITVITRGGGRARQFSAFPDGKSVAQLRLLEKNCSKDHPVKIVAYATEPGKYSSQYIRFYQAF